MSIVYKLFIEVIKLFMPKLNIASVLTSVMLKVVFALVFGGMAVGSVYLVKNKYTEYKHNKELREKAEQDLRNVVDVNKGLVTDIEKTQTSGKITVDAVIGNVEATEKIKDTTDTILADLNQTRKDIEAGKPPVRKVIKKKDPKSDKTPTAGTPGGGLLEIPVTQTDANINAMWDSYCSMGGKSTTCASNT